MAEKIGEHMATDGTKFLKKCVPTKVSVSSLLWVWLSYYVGVDACGGRGGGVV